MAFYPYKSMVHFVCKGWTVIENEKWKIKVFAPPKEHGPAYVHVIAKGEKSEVKISLVTLEIIGSTQFSVRTVKGIIKYIYENYEYLWNCWEALHGKDKKTKSKTNFKKSR